MGGASPIGRAPVKSLHTALATGVLGTILSLATAPAALAAPDRASAARIAAPDLSAYHAIWAQLDRQAWTDARAAILRLDADDPMRPYLLAKLYLAKDSPRVELFDLLDILARAPHLPQAEQLSRLAVKRGAQILPDRPQIRQLVYTGGSPQRSILKPLAGDPVADQILPSVVNYIKLDQPAAAEALIDGQSAGIGAAALTELRQRVAWSYYITNDVANARRLAMAAAAGGQGPFVAPAYWVAGLAAWRAQDWRDAAAAFSQVAARTGDADLRSAGHYWAARARMAAGQPQNVNRLLTAAAREEESFYGLLARETLGIQPPRSLVRTTSSASDRRALERLPNVRVAATLATMGRIADADETLRHQATLSEAGRYDALIDLAGDLSLPRTQLWLAQRSPDGVKKHAYLRYPAPAWTPERGWRVDKALLFAHALQESRFQTDVVSPAGARGLMQVMPGTASDLARERGEQVNTADLSNPSLNMEYGQRYLEKLSRMGATDGLLAKVVAAYNAGPVPVERWRDQVQDGGDPLLFIESVPYYETRAYLNAVLRNFWMYQMEEAGHSPALAAMAQGLWSRFPGTGRDAAVRIQANGRARSAD